METQKKAERLLDQISQVSDCFLEQTLDTDTEEVYVSLGRQGTGAFVTRRKSSQIWRMLRNVAVASIALFIIVAMGSRGGSCGGPEPYFNHIYRIQGVNYTRKGKNYLRIFQWDELWMEVNGEEVLCHRFPLGAGATWSEEREAFVYRKGRSIYQWDLETKRETRIYRLPGRSLWTMVMDFFLDRFPQLWEAMENHLLLKDSDGVPVLVDLTDGSEIRLEALKKSYSCMTMEDYILFDRDDGNTRLGIEERTLVLVELSTGKEIDYIALGKDRVKWWSTEGNQAFFTVYDSKTGDQLYRYDADSQQLVPLNIEYPEQTAEEAGGHRNLFAAGMVSQGILWCVQEWEKDSLVVYQLDGNGTLLAYQTLPKGHQFETMTLGDGTMILVTKTELLPEDNTVCVLHYYYFTETGEGSEVFTWQVLDALTLHPCVVICDGELVVSGCQLEEQRIQFSVGDTQEIKVEEIYGR